jgi:hypothetical protein
VVLTPPLTAGPVIGELLDGTARWDKVLPLVQKCRLNSGVMTAGKDRHLSRGKQPANTSDSDLGSKQAYCVMSRTLTTCTGKKSAVRSGRFGGVLVAWLNFWRKPKCLPQWVAPTPAHHQFISTGEFHGREK